FALPLFIWLMVDFIREIPRDLEEAASVDGAGRLAALRHVLLPVLAPGLAATSLLTFLFAWNEFLLAYTFTAPEASRTAPVAPRRPGPLSRLLQTPLGRHRRRFEARLPPAYPARSRLTPPPRARPSRGIPEGMRSI